MKPNQPRVTARHTIDSYEVNQMCGDHYETTSVTGPDHSKVFEVSVLIRGEVWATGTGHSKQAAAKEAARLALEKIGQDIT